MLTSVRVLLSGRRWHVLLLSSSTGVVPMPFLFNCWRRSTTYLACKRLNVAFIARFMVSIALPGFAQLEEILCIPTKKEFVNFMFEILQ